MVRVKQIRLPRSRIFAQGTIRLQEVREGSKPQGAFPRTLHWTRTASLTLASDLQNFIEKIRTDYTNDFKDEEMVIRQRATAIYFIDRLALRNGNEKGEDEADTVGCCSLRFEHITLTPPTTVTFDFLGKDSIRYINEVEVDELVFKNLKIFKKAPKEVGDLLFDRLSVRLSFLRFSHRFPVHSSKSSFSKLIESSTTDWTSQQVPRRIHGRTDGESLPNVQRLANFCRTTRFDSSRRFFARQDSRL